MNSIADTVFTSGPWPDESPNALSVTATMSAPTFVAGPELYFEMATDEAYEVPADPAVDPGTRDFTLAFVIRTEETPSGAAFAYLAKADGNIGVDGEGYAFGDVVTEFLTGTGAFAGADVTVRGATHASVESIGEGWAHAAWHLVVVRADRGVDLEVWVDGSLFASERMGILGLFGDLSADVPLTIGPTVTAGSGSPSADFQSVGFWTRAVSDTELEALTALFAWMREPLP